MKNIKQVGDASVTLAPVIANDAESTVISKTGRRLTPSLSETFFIGCLLLTLNIGSTFLQDGDIWGHILTGETILKTFRIPFQDIYSSTAAGHPWIAHEWLAEIIFALFYKIGGVSAVVFLSVTMVSLTFYFLYKFLLHRQINPLLAVFLTTFAALVSRLLWVSRPHLFSFVFLIGFLIILELFEREDLNYLKWLPLMMILWVNLHAGSVLGLGILAMYAGGTYLQRFSQTTEREVAQRKFKLLGRTFLWTLAAALVNPWGAKILLLPFQLMSMKIVMNSFPEWMSPNFHDFRLAHVFLVICIAIPLLSKKRLDIFEAGLFVLLLYMSLYSVRHLALITILVTPLVAGRAQDLLEEITGHLSQINFIRRLKTGSEAFSQQIRLYEMQRKSSAWIYIVLALCFMNSWTIARTSGMSFLNFKVDRRLFPIYAAEFMHQNHISGKMFNQDYWGGYLLKQTYPDTTIFFDGRTYLYGDEITREYFQVANVANNFENILNKYEVTLIIYQAHTPLSRALQFSDNWKLVFADGVANIFLKDVPENREIIEKFPHVHIIPKGFLPVDSQIDESYFR